MPRVLNVEIHATVVLSYPDPPPIEPPPIEPPPIEPPSGVGDKASLLAALANATAGEVVNVAGTAAIDLSGEESIGVPGGVTLKGNGALLYSDVLRTFPLFRTLGPNVRITGLRLRGPDDEKRDSEYAVPNSRAIDIQHAGAEIDHNEIWAWSHAGVYSMTGAGSPHIHNNDLHHIQRYGLGYPVLVDRSTPLVEHNIFDWGRHAIAGTGNPGTGYEFAHNTILPNFYQPPIDMHKDAVSGLAGDWVHIHHNDVQSITNNSQVWIEGVPAKPSTIHDNVFADKVNPIAQRVSGVIYYPPNLVNIDASNNGQ